MLRPQKVGDVLDAAKVPGVHAVMMIKGDGTLIAISRDGAPWNAAAAAAAAAAATNAGVSSPAPVGAGSHGKGGNVYGSSGVSRGNDPHESIFAAISASVWTSFQSQIQSDAPTEELECVVMQLDNGRLAIRPMSQNLLCVIGDVSVEFGMLRAVASKTAEYLEAELGKITRPIQEAEPLS